PSGLFQALLACFASDHRLKIANHEWERMRADHAADDVMGMLDGRHPVSEGLVDGVSKGAAAAAHRDDLTAERFHFEDVEPLPPDIFLAHVDLTFQAEERSRGC